MPGVVPVTVRATSPASPERTFAIIVPIDLTRIFTGLGPLPAVTETRDQTGAWDHVGASRTAVLSDGSTAFERITAHDPPARFAYEVGPFTNALGRLVDGARGEWTFTPARDGTAIRWTYAFRPRPWRRAVVHLLIAPVWRRYMRRALNLAVAEVTRTA